MIWLKWHKNGECICAFAVLVLAYNLGVFVKILLYQRRDSKAVMPRPAKPFSPVRLRIAPPIKSMAYVNF